MTHVEIGPLSVMIYSYMSRPIAIGTRVGVVGDAFFRFVITLLSCCYMSLLSFGRSVFGVSSFPLFVGPLSPGRFLWWLLGSTYGDVECAREYFVGP